MWISCFPIALVVCTVWCAVKVFNLASSYTAGSKFLPKTSFWCSPEEQMWQVDLSPKRTEIRCRLLMRRNSAIRLVTSSVSSNIFSQSSLSISHLLQGYGDVSWGGMPNPSDVFTSETLKRIYCILSTFFDQASFPNLSHRVHQCLLQMIFFSGQDNEVDSADWSSFERNMMFRLYESIISVSTTDWAMDLYYQIVFLNGIRNSLQLVHIIRKPPFSLNFHSNIWGHTYNHAREDIEVFQLRVANKIPYVPFPLPGFPMRERFRSGRVEGVMKGCGMLHAGMSLSYHACSTNRTCSHGSLT